MIDRKNKIYNYLNKDVKECNKYILSFVCLIILICAGCISFYFTNKSYAYFTDDVNGSKTIGLGVSLCENNEYVEQSDTSFANPPLLDSNMIPVYYDECREVWRKADENNADGYHKWYNYSKKQWANSVTVTSETREKYIEAEPGIDIAMEDILTMQVWIPRYKYVVWNYNASGNVISSPQTISIIFEEDTESTGEISCTDSISGTDGNPSETCVLNSTNATCTDNTCNGKTYTHPAFTFGDDELKGFWVGKFELTGTSSNVTVKPDLTSLTNLSIGAFDSLLRGLNSNDNIYGFNATTDTHMIKNSEWGAVAYLSHSKYGKNSEIFINNSSGFYTGRSGGNVVGETAINTVYTNQSSTTTYNTHGFYTYDGYLLNYGTNTKSSTKDLTKVASTTGNIYGIYDMSGGRNESTMSNLVSPNGSTMISGLDTSSNSDFSGILYDSGNFTSYTGAYTYPDDKYLDKYSYGTIANQRIRSKLGDAMKEVHTDELIYNSPDSSWYRDVLYIVRADTQWALRGGYATSSSKSVGIFYANFSTGAKSSAATRLVIATS